MVMIDMIWQAARRRGIKVSVRRNVKKQGVYLKALTKRSNNAAHEDMEASRATAGKPLRNHKKGTKRRKLKVRGT
jgi:hypothetical protein